MTELVKGQRFFGRRTTNGQITITRNRDREQQRARQKAAAARKTHDDFDDFCGEQQRRLGAKLQAAVTRIANEADARSMSEEVYEHRK